MQLSPSLKLLNPNSRTPFQKAELTALTRSLTLTANKRANVYTDSKCAFHIIHSHAAIWKDRGLLCTKGSRITNSLLTLQLLKAANMPTEVCIIHCRGHQVASDSISWDNDAANRKAKEASLWSPAQQVIVIPNIKPLYHPEEKSMIITRGSTTTRRLVAKTGPLCPSSISGHADSYWHPSGPTCRH